MRILTPEPQGTSTENMARVGCKGGLAMMFNPKGKTQRDHFRTRLCTHVRVTCFEPESANRGIRISRSTMDVDPGNDRIDNSPVRHTTFPVPRINGPTSDGPPHPPSHSKLQSTFPPTEIPKSRYLASDSYHPFLLLMRSVRRLDPVYFASGWNPASISEGGGCL